MSLYSTSPELADNHPTNPSPSPLTPRSLPPSNGIQQQPSSSHNALSSSQPSSSTVAGTTSTSSVHVHPQRTVRLKCRNVRSDHKEVRLVLVDETTRFTELNEKLRISYCIEPENTLSLRYQDKEGDIIVLQNQDDLDALIHSTNNHDTINVFIAPTDTKFTAAAVLAGPTPTLRSSASHLQPLGIGGGVQPTPASASSNTPSLGINNNSNTLSIKPNINNNHHSSSSAAVLTIVPPTTSMVVLPPPPTQQQGQQQRGATTPLEAVLHELSLTYPTGGDKDEDKMMIHEEDIPDNYEEEEEYSKQQQQQRRRTPTTSNHSKSRVPSGNHHYVPHNNHKQQQHNQPLPQQSSQITQIPTKTINKKITTASSFIFQPSTTTTTNDPHHQQHIIRETPSPAPTTTTTTVGTQGVVGHPPPGATIIHPDEPVLSSPTNINENNNSTTAIRWQRGQKIGVGAYGTVYMALNLTNGELIAVKQFDTSDIASKELAALEHEIGVLKDLHHENIVQYYGTQRTDSSLSIFLEYAPGGSLRQMIERFGRLDETVIRVYTRQLLLGLEYLHRHGIAHRDIKGGNVLLGGDGIIKLADFGQAKRLGGSRTMTGEMKGTPLWMAPEVISEQPMTRGWRKADIWSVGCTVIEMATGHPPWSNFSNTVTVLYNIAMTNAIPELPDHLSSHGKDFLMSCFQRDPAKRPDATLLLLHPFVANVGQSAAFLGPNRSGFLLSGIDRPSGASFPGTTAAFLPPRPSTSHDHRDRGDNEWLLARPNRVPTGRRRHAGTGSARIRQPSESDNGSTATVTTADPVNDYNKNHKQDVPVNDKPKTSTVRPGSNGGKSKPVTGEKNDLVSASSRVISMTNLTEFINDSSSADEEVIVDEHEEAAMIRLRNKNDHTYRYYNSGVKPTNPSVGGGGSSLSQESNASDVEGDNLTSGIVVGNEASSIALSSLDGSFDGSMRDEQLSLPNNEPNNSQHNNDTTTDHNNRYEYDSSSLPGGVVEDEPTYHYDKNTVSQEIMHNTDNVKREKTRTYRIPASESKKEVLTAHSNSNNYTSNEKSPRISNLQSIDENETEMNMKSIRNAANRKGGSSAGPIHSASTVLRKLDDTNNNYSSNKVTNSSSLAIESDMYLSEGISDIEFSRRGQVTNPPPSNRYSYGSYNVSNRMGGSHSARLHPTDVLHNEKHSNKIYMDAIQSGGSPLPLSSVGSAEASPSSSPQPQLMVNVEKDRSNSTILRDGSAGTSRIPKPRTSLVQSASRRILDNNTTISASVHSTSSNNNSNPNNVLGTSNDVSAASEGHSSKNLRTAKSAATIRERRIDHAQKHGIYIPNESSVLPNNDSIAYTVISDTTVTDSSSSSKRRTGGIPSSSSLSTNPSSSGANNSTYPLSTLPTASKSRHPSANPTNRNNLRTSNPPPRSSLGGGHSDDYNDSIALHSLGSFRNSTNNNSSNGSVTVNHSLVYSDVGSNAGSDGDGEYIKLVGSTTTNPSSLPTTNVNVHPSSAAATKSSSRRSIAYNVATQVYSGTGIIHLDNAVPPVPDLLSANGEIITPRAVQASAGLHTSNPIDFSGSNLNVNFQRTASSSSSSSNLLPTNDTIQSNLTLLHARSGGFKRPSRTSIAPTTIIHSTNSSLPQQSNTTNNTDSSHTTTMITNNDPLGDSVNNNNMLGNSAPLSPSATNPSNSSSSYASQYAQRKALMLSRMSPVMNRAASGSLSSSSVSPVRQIQTSTTTTNSGSTDLRYTFVNADDPSNLGYPPSMQYPNNPSMMNSSNWTGPISPIAGIIEANNNTNSGNTGSSMNNSTFIPSASPIRSPMANNLSQSVPEWIPLSPSNMIMNSNANSNNNNNNSNTNNANNYGGTNSTLSRESTIGPSHSPIQHRRILLSPQASNANPGNR